MGCLWLSLGAESIALPAPARGFIKVVWADGFQNLNSRQDCGLRQIQTCSQVQAAILRKNGFKRFNFAA
jgi:hypothetical protein